MSIRTTARTGMMGLALAVSLGLMTGCGAAAEPGEGLPAGGVDADRGSVTIEGDDGDSVTIESGNGGEIPSWFPSELPLPNDYTVVNSTEVESDGETLRGLNLTATDTFDDFVATVDAALAALGVSPSPREIGDLGGMKSAMYGIGLDGGEWMVNAIDYGQGEDLVVSYASSTE